MTSGKLFEGQTGFPTPNTAIETSACRTFRIPDSDDWLGLLMGAVQLLCNEYAWYQWGDLTPVEAAAAWLEIVSATYDEAEFHEGACTIVDAPFWDDVSADDADDEAEAPEQTWYGVWDGETFVEALSYWAVTAFLATGISEGAAIEFITPLRAFRLTLKKNPHGAKLLILMDSNIFQLVDLFSATDEVAYVDIVSPGSTLMLVHSGEHNDDATPDANGDYPITVIKSQLSDNQVIPPDIRYTDDDPPVFQMTVDGSTWVDAPQSDPRYNPVGLLPALANYSGIECDVAARMTAQLKDTLDILITSIDAAQFATGLLAVLVFPLGMAGWFLDLALFIAETLIDIGQANIESAFTSGVYDDIKCTFSCYIGDDGSITQAALDHAYDEIKATHAGTVATTIDQLRLFYGDVAMSNAGVSRQETGDCSGCDDCAWCVDLDMNASAWGWIPRIVTGSPCNQWGGVWVEGQGWVTLGYVSLSIEIQVPAGTRITRLAYHADTTAGCSFAVLANVHADLSGSNVFRVNAQDSGAIDYTLAADTYLCVLLQTPGGSGCNNANHNIDRVTIEGIGTKPDVFPTSNC